MRTSAERKALLESLVDETSVAGVLEDLAFVCLEKRDHIRTNWQDRLAAKPWDSVGRAIGRLSGKVLI